MIKTSIYKDLSYQVIGAAMDVHNELGPGFPEKVYQEAMIIALSQRHIRVLKEVAFDVAFRGQAVGSFRIDLLVDDAVIVELKALQTLDATCEQQIIAYLAATGRELGLLLNFGRVSLERKRFVPPKQSKNHLLTNIGVSNGNPPGFRSKNLLHLLNLLRKNNEELRAT